MVARIFNVLLLVKVTALYVLEYNTSFAQVSSPTKLTELNRGIYEIGEKLHKECPSFFDRKLAENLLILGRRQTTETASILKKRDAMLDLELRLAEKTLAHLTKEYETCVKGRDPCASSPCLNGSTCYVFSGNVWCECVSGFGGKHCEKDLDNAK
ncbi:coagulation factor X-like [Lingula anatina]|uniref:Coagulation factor X-like n=1 Tax=Lingula anatina TaxID=7574 RepID=A0A1S3HBY5_LINAN|nr:coagulation factor X-like [Lingula anatina]|eukprot:XP_013382664.1 coagulation factor X-like [Lingula anatina]